MVADADLQVWLDSTPGGGQMVMVPYVKSVNDVRLGFRMDVLQQAGAGTSRISQQGQITARAAQPTPLGQVTVSVQPDANCKVELTLKRDGQGESTYRFDCTGQPAP